jgi:hypothetical protein
MPSIVRYFAQAVFYTGMILVIGFFADTPSYQYFPPDMAMIKVAFAHGGKSKKGCHKLTGKELSKLAPNMRRKTLCSRERVPLLLELQIDGKTVFKGTLEPTGIRKDGPGRIYKNFKVATGPHKIVALLKDTKRGAGYDWIGEKEVDLKPVQQFVIQFRPEFGGFVFQ